MSLAIVYSRAQVGVEAPVVTVEAHLANGLPALTLVGQGVGDETAIVALDLAKYGSNMAAAARHLYGSTFLR